MRAYRILLHLYPRSFRRDFGAEMCVILHRRLATAGGPVAVSMVWVDAVRDVVASAARVHWDLLAQDVRYAVRTLSRSRGFAGTAILVMALGIGATTATFSIADHVLLRPLPFPDSDRLVRLWQDQSFRGYPQMELSPSNFLDWKRMATSFEGIGAFTPHSANLIGAGDPQQIGGAAVTSDVFAVLRVPAARGRPLASMDDNLDTQRAIVLSNRLWQTTFGGDASVVGRTVILDDDPHVVVGVMPAGFEFPRREVEYWVPLRFAPAALKDRTDTYLNVVARLRTGVSLDLARSEMRLVAGALERAYPKENAQTGATVRYMRDQVSRQAQMLLIGLVAAAVCMLLIACTNLSNLLLARGLTRRVELAVRMAVGAGRERLIRQTLTESVVLAATGGVLGVLIAVVAMPLVARLVPTTLPIPETPDVDLRMLAAAAVVTLATGMGVGALPALRMTTGHEADALREGGRVGTRRSTERVRGALVAAAIAASIVLLVSSGLLVRALWRVQQVDPGFRAENVLTLRTALPQSKYGSTAARQQFYDRVLGEIKALPGVTNAAFIGFLPMSMRGGIWPVILDFARLIPEARRSWAPDPRETRMASFRPVTPGFFATLGIPVLRGRDVSDADTADSLRVAVVSQSFVDQMWPGQDPIGRQFFMAYHERTVVGVVGTIRVRGLEQESEPQVYVPSRQTDTLIFYAPKDLAVTGSVPMTTLVPAIRQIIARVDPQQAISNLRMLTEVVETDMTARRVQLRVLGGFAAISFLLAAVGIHGLLAFMVSSRAREIGLRMALGARTGEVVHLVVGRGLWLTAAGVSIGLVVAVGAGRALQVALAGVSPTDPAPYLGAVMLAVVMTLAGCVVPAVRAVRVDPITAIRTE